MNCPYCGSNSVEFIRSDNENRWEQWQCDRCGMPFTANHGYIEDEHEYIIECSMCGKETKYRACGMCPRCEMVWNG